MTSPIKLKEIAHGRSGDKGNHANVGILAYTPEGYAFLERELTAGKVKAFFAALEPREVERFPLPGIRAFNFLLKDVLGGGASDSLRTDTQGKVLATALLELELPRPAGLEAMLPGSREAAPGGTARAAATPAASGRAEEARG